MNLPSFSDDAVEFLALLARHEVRYVLVGAVSVIYHGYPRYTGDVDVLYDRSSGNVARLFAAVRAFWEGEVPGGLARVDLERPGAVVQFGVAPNRIDLVNEIDGLTFEEAWGDHVVEEVTDSSGARRAEARILGLESLKKNKRASGRPKDLDDIENL